MRTQVDDGGCFVNKAISPLFNWHAYIEFIVYLYYNKL